MKIVPAILAKNRMEFDQYLKICQTLPVNEIQIDVADGKFVNNQTVTIDEILPIIENLSFRWQFHLMVENPQSIIEQIIELKNSQIYIHCEAIKDNLNSYKNRGLGLAINTKTTIDEVVSLIEGFDSMLIMTVETGFYGGKFLEENMEKINQLRKMGFKGRIGIDGGINFETLTNTITHKPDFVCSGSYLLNSEKPMEVWEKYQKLIYPPSFNLVEK